MYLPHFLNASIFGHLASLRKCGHRLKMNLEPIMLYRLANVGWPLIAAKTIMVDDRQINNGAGHCFDLLGLGEAELIDVVSSISTTTTRWQGNDRPDNWNYDFMCVPLQSP